MKLFVPDRSAESETPAANAALCRNLYPSIDNLSSQLGLLLLLLFFLYILATKFFDPLLFLSDLFSYKFAKRLQIEALAVDALIDLRVARDAFVTLGWCFFDAYKEPYIEIDSQTN